MPGRVACVFLDRRAVYHGANHETLTDYRRIAIRTRDRCRSGPSPRGSLSEFRGSPLLWSGCNRSPVLPSLLLPLPSLLPPCASDHRQGAACDRGTATSVLRPTLSSSLVGRTSETTSPARCDGTRPGPGGVHPASQRASGVFPTQAAGTPPAVSVMTPPLRSDP